jgi:hypothetical protein
MDWRPGGFTVNTDHGPRTVAGWISEPFALDFRVWWNRVDEDYTKGWLLTHIPTGFQCFGIAASLERAFEIAGRMSALGDWNFTDPEAKKPLLPAVRSLVEELGNELLMGGASLAPLYEAGKLAA